jgi:hypothetical protein
MFRPSPGLVFVIALAFLLAACFEEPVREELELRLAADGTAEVALTTTILVPDEEIDNLALRNRLESERRRLLLGEDDWVRRFERLDALSQETTFERDHGVLASARQSARVSLASDPEALGRFFSDTLVGAFYSGGAAGDGTAELALFPLAPGRAGRRERQRLERAIDPWTEVLARYFRAAGRLYDYLEEHPDRAEVAFSVLLEEVLPEEDGGRRELLHRHEEPLVEAVDQAMTDAWEVLLVSSQEAYSINEVSRLVYDPFPARLRVEVPGEVVAIEGFAATPESGLVVPTVSLWQALTDLQGLWLEPDPLLLYVDRSGGTTGAPGPGFDLAGIVARERSHAPAPRAAEIRAALETRLLPAPVYRVVFRVDEEAAASSARR